MRNRISQTKTEGFTNISREARSYRLGAAFPTEKVVISIRALLLTFPGFKVTGKIVFHPNETILEAEEVFATIDSVPEVIEEMYSNLLHAYVDRNGPWENTNLDLTPKDS